MFCVDGFRILEHGAPRPPADRILFCDGSGGNIFQDGADVELSHWRPNRTPAAYRAGTSTEICFRFLDAPVSGEWTLAVNNHLDVDGILSLYVLLHPEAAAANRRAIIEAAEMGDFWGWGEPDAQRLFQWLTRLMHQRGEADVSLEDVYQEAFDRVVPVLRGTDPESRSVDDSLEPLRAGVRLVERGKIGRSQRGPRFAAYVLRDAVVGNDIDRGLAVPAFNEAVSDRLLLWPQARARWDRQRACLVSVEGLDGWFHDLWFPGYLWADTEGLWTVPGFQFHDGMQSYDLTNPHLLGSADALQAREPERGTWAVGRRAPQWTARLAQDFPLVMRFLDDDGRPAPSGLGPDDVAVLLDGAFD